MSYPNVPDFVVIQVMSTAQTPVPITLCGIETSGINRTANTTDRIRRDCDKPGAVPTRKVFTSSKTWDVTGSGVLNMDMLDEYDAALGISRTYRVLYGKRDGTDEGVIFGYYTGPAVLTSSNDSIGEDGTAEITLAGEDWPTWTTGEPA